MVEPEKNLERIYFQLLSEFVKYSLDQKYILARMTEQIKIIYDTNLTALYLFNDHDQSYYLESTASKNDTYIPKKRILKSDNFNKELIVNQVPVGQDLKVYPLSFHLAGKGMLVIAAEPNIPDIDELFIIEETEKFLTIIMQILDERISNYNHQFLLDLSKRLFSEIEKNTILTEIVHAMKMLYPDDSCTLLLSQDNEEITSLPIKTIEFNDTNHLSTQTFITGEFQMENRLDRQGMYLYAPLTGKQGIYGVLQITTDKAILFTENQIEFIKQFSTLAGTALERAILYENSKHQVNSLSQINEFTQKLNANLEVLEIIKLVKEEIIHISDPSEIGFVIMEEAEDIQLIKQSTLFFRTEEGKQFAEQLYLKTKNNKESLFSGQIKEDVIFPFKSLMAIPINHGLVIVLHKDAYSFTFESFKLLETLIQHATLALTNAYLKDKLHKAVITDYLTGLYSRNYLESKINEDMSKGQKGVLLLFDIDDFKKINDKYGHHIGDKVIKQIAEVFLSYCHSNDVPARWGGEELAVYLPNRSLKESEKFADLIRNEVSAITNPHVTMSCGISSWVKGESNSIINLFIRTDKALYKAKNKGKNCVVKN